MTSAPGNNAMAAQPGPANAMAGNHGNTAYLNSQAAVAAALKQQQQQHQQQILEQQKHQQQQHYIQRQQLMAEQVRTRVRTRGPDHYNLLGELFVYTDLSVCQEKQRQDQQLQRHLTRPPPQYQDQPGQPANQNPFPQQPVNQFTGETFTVSDPVDPVLLVLLVVVEDKRPLFVSRV